MAQFLNYHIIIRICGFSPLWKNLGRFNTQGISSLDPRTLETEQQVQKIITYNILQITCQKHLLIIRVSLNPLILLAMRPKEWRYQ